MLTPLQSDAVPDRELLCSSGRQREHQIEFALLQKTWGSVSAAHDDPVHTSYVLPFLCQTGMCHLLKKRRTPQRQWNTTVVKGSLPSGKQEKADSNKGLIRTPFHLKQIAKESEEKLLEIINNLPGWKASVAQACGGLILKEGQHWYLPPTLQSPHPLLPRVCSALPGEANSAHPPAK